MWRVRPGGPLWSGTRGVVASGAAFAAINYVGGRSADSALLSGVIFASLTGFVRIFCGTRAWPGGEALSGKDYADVFRSVARGMEVEDIHLAPAVLDYAAASRRRWSKNRQNQRVLGLFAAGTLIAAIVETIDHDPVGHLLVLWMLVVGWVILLVRAPQRRTRALERVAHAESSARRVAYVPRDP